MERAKRDLRGLGEEGGFDFNEFLIIHLRAKGAQDCGLAGG